MDIAAEYKKLIETAKRLKEEIPKNQKTKSENVAEIKKLLEEIDHLYQQSAGNLGLLLLDLEGLTMLSKMLVNALD